jgi:translation initiation factor 4E
VWEDPLNLSGGKWIIRLKKGVSDRLWEDIVLAVLGEQFDDLQPPTDEDPDEWPGICGCTISVRPNEDIISVWNRYEADTQIREKIRQASRWLRCLYHY